MTENEISFDPTSSLLPIAGRWVELRGQNKPSAWALVDFDDYEKTLGYRWCRQTNRAGNVYAVTPRLGLMHSFLTGLSFVDHVNGNGLDNRKINLRTATRSQNNMNMRPRKNKITSEYKGVSFDARPERAKAWRMRIVKDGVVKTGYFSTELEAAQAYDDAALELFGEYARLNFIVSVAA